MFCFVFCIKKKQWEHESSSVLIYVMQWDVWTWIRETSTWLNNKHTCCSNMHLLSLPLCLFIDRSSVSSLQGEWKKSPQLSARQLQLSSRRYKEPHSVKLFYFSYIVQLSYLKPFNDSRAQTCVFYVCMLYISKEALHFLRRWQ